MDTSCLSGGDISSSDCGDSGEETMAVSVEPSAGSSISAWPGASSPATTPSSRCRKSSRLKEKKEKKAQDPAASGADASSDAYNLRLSSLVKRVQVESRQSTPKQPKGKSKPPPLSKYRRRTANARERMRMKDINEGYEKLRQCLPDLDQPGEELNDSSSKKEKPTKFTILSLALNYIHALRDILGYPPVEGNTVAKCKSGASSAEKAAASSTSTSSSLNVNAGAVIAGVNSEESDLGSDVSFNPTSTVSAPSSSSCSSSVVLSCDELCSNLSPISNSSCSSVTITTSNASSSSSTSAISASSPEVKKYSLVEEVGSPLLSGVLHKDFSVTAPLMSRCHDPLPGSSAMMDFRAEARSSPSSSVSDLSLSSPSPPPALELPEDCMDLDQSDLLHVSIPLAALDGMVEMVMS